MELRVTLSGERPSRDSMADFSGVGLLRGEFLLRDRQEHLTIHAARQSLRAYIEEICSLFAPRAVWYRLCDFWSDEANVLSGNDQEVDEHNPMLGNRGIRRGLRAPASLRLEMEAVAEVAHRHDNLHLLFPFVSDAHELAAATRLLGDIGWPNAFGAMIEIPSAVLDARRFLDLGARNLLIGMNDLSCLMLGRERGGDENKLHASVWWAVDQVSSAVGHEADWGIGGALSPAILDMARERDVPYVTIHYADLPLLVGTSRDSLQQIDYVKDVKRKTRDLIRERDRLRSRSQQ